MASTPKKKKKSRGPKVGECVLVNWNDACVYLGWEDHRHSQATTSKCVSIGWLGASKEKECILLYADKDHGGEGNDSNRRIAIPKDWVTNMKVVKL